MASTNRDEISRLELLHAAHPDGLVFPHLADAYRRAGRYAQAESVLNAGLRRHSDYSSAHVVLGRLRMDQGKRSEARNAFHRVLQLDPDNPVALELLGRLSEEEGRTREALTYFRRLARVKPTDALDQRIEALEARERDIRRGEAGGITASGAPGQEPARRPGSNGGDGDGGVAAEGAQAAGEPGLPEPGEVVTETMAELYARQGLHERAEAVYRELLRRDPGNSRLEARLQEAASRARPSPGRASHPDATGAGDPAEWVPLSGISERGPPATTGAVDASAADGSTSGAAVASIREYMATKLSWRPGSGEAQTVPEPVVEPEPDLEPWAEAPVTPPETARDDEAGAEGPSELEAVQTDTMSSGGSGTEAPSAPSRSRPGVTAEELGLVEYELDGADSSMRALIALTDMLVGLLEYRDPFFRGSSSLTRLLAMNVAEEMKLKPSERVNLALAAVLRDLGRLAMGGRLVNVNKSRTPEARRKIERHVDLALQLLEGIDLPRPVRLAVRHHHERLDGGGYPDGLAGSEIPLLARVLAVVDSFAAMVSPRPYRLPRKVPEAVRELKEATGTHYDPQVVDAILRVLERREQPRLGFVQRHHILMVNPDQPGAVVTAAKLCTAGYLAEVAVNTGAARERLRRVPVAAVVASAEAGREPILDLIRDLRLDPLFASLPIVVVDAETVELRVRLLEGGADVCFPPGISYGELQGTLGALVRRTVRGREQGGEGSDGEAPWLALQGDLKDFPLAWLLQVMKYDSRTAGIGIRTATEQGAIYLEGGDAVHAQVRGGQRGEAALKEMLAWQEGRFTVQPDARPRERSIESSIMHFLLTHAVEEDHEAAGIFGAVNE